MFTKIRNLLFPTWKLAQVFIYDRATYSDENVEIYYYCYVSNRGGRKYEVGSSIADDQLVADELKNFRETTVLYATVIKPWLEGRYHMDIPSYADLDGIDALNVTAGTNVGIRWDGGP